MIPVIAWKGYPQMRYSKNFREKALLLVLGVLAHFITTKLSTPVPSGPPNPSPAPQVETQSGWRRDVPQESGNWQAARR
jgi:hypothetical protein